MIPSGATRIASLTAENGVVNVRFEGTKQGVCFTSMSELQSRIAWAQDLNPYVQFILHIAAHLSTDPTLANPAALSSKPFVPDAVVLPEMVIE